MHRAAAVPCQDSLLAEPLGLFLTNVAQILDSKTNHAARFGLHTIVLGGLLYRAMLEKKTEISDFEAVLELEALVIHKFHRIQNGSTTAHQAG